MMSVYRGAIDIDGEDPGRGDPADVRGAAGRRRTAADVSMEAATQLGAVPNEAGQWRGAFAQVMTAESLQHAAELAVVAEQWRSDASALEMYAATVQDIATRYEALRTSYLNAKHDLAIARNQVAEFLGITERQSPVSTTVAAAEARLRTLGAQYQELLLERRATDNHAVMLLTSTEARGGLAQLGAGAIGGSSVPTLAELAGMDRSDLATLLKLNPDLLAQLTASNPPENVAAWWGSLGEPQQTALVLGASGVIGALSGIPPLARAAANRVNATRALATIDEEIRSAEESRPSGALREEVFADQLEKLRDERAYIAEVVAGTVQLYLWDRDRGHIVEMIGDFTKEYHRVITYTPGTFTNMQSFYDGSVQEAAMWFIGENSGAVSFVWKGAEFPGQTRELGKPADTFIGINEANAQQLALDTGAALADFQNEIRADPRIDGSQSIAMGHSWGLAATTGSEVAGAHYDQVHSLAGAWMPRDWEADADTGYYHWSYTDFLSVAQDFGLVGGGNVPDTDPDFTSKIYDSPEDSTIYIPTTANPWAPTPAGEIRSATRAGLTENHALIATQEDRNLEALRDMRLRMNQ